MSDDQLLLLLQNLFDNVEGVRSAAIVSNEGLIVHSNLAAMTATILSVSERVLMELKSGRLDVCILQGEDGNFAIMEAGEDLILAMCLDIDARMDTCFIEMRKASEQIKSLF